MRRLLRASWAFIAGCEVGFAVAGWFGVVEPSAGVDHLARGLVAYLMWEEMGRWKVKP